MFTCPACTEIAVLKDIRGGVDGQQRAMQMIASGMGDVAKVLSTGMSRISDELSTLASIVQGGFDGLKWELEQQTQILLSIDATLKTPSQTQAREWREMAEQLRARGCFDEAQQWFQKSLEMSPLDFRTYVGFAMTFLQKNDFDEAEKMLTRSLLHAPKGRPISGRRTSNERRFTIDQEVEDELAFPDNDEDSDETDDELDSLLAEMDEPEAPTRQVAVFDYKSLSHRLIGRIWACRGDYCRAASELRQAVTLSPEYTEGNYDYALYAVQSGEADHWDTSLRRAIDNQPGYFGVVVAERRFSPAEQQVSTLLSGLLNEARRHAAQTVQAAENNLAAARNTVAQTPDPRAHQKSVNYIARRLTAAKQQSTSGDYVTVLKAAPLANEVAALSKSLTQTATEQASEFSAEQQRRKKNALMVIPQAIAWILAGGLFVGVVFGVLGWIGADDHGLGLGGRAHGWHAGFRLGFWFSIVVGVIWGAIEYQRKLEGKD